MRSYLERLNEELETKYFDGILDEAVYGGSKWSNLSDEERQECLNADPTYKGKEDSAGKYSEWIFKIYSDFKKNHSDEKFRFDHCKDALTQFMSSKNNLRDKSKRDIFQFESLNELDNFLSSSQNFKNTFIEAPEDENNVKGAKKVFENNRCEIWVPLTHEASVALAGEPKTKWCTAFSNPYNYNSYTKEGPLFILIMKDNSGEMYQFHFERNAAMDKHDDPVKREDFPEMQSQEIKNFRKEYFKEADKGTCKQIDSLLQNPDLSVKRLNSLVDTLHDEGLSDKYSKKVDKAICTKLDSLLNGRTHVPELEDNLGEVTSLIRGIHDEDLALKYSEPFDKECLEQFYANLTPVLDRDSLSIRYLERCAGKVDIVIPGNVISIGGHSFCCCSSLESVKIPDSVISIERGAFSGCPSLKSVVISNGITSIRDCAFYECRSLKSVVIPNSVTTIEDDAFGSCSSLEFVVIPEGVTSIEDSAFRNCFSLRGITIPSSMTKIGSCVFYGDTLLKDIYYGGSQEDREAMQIGVGSGVLFSAAWHYNWKK